jgi:hypothetical protein
MNRITTTLEIEFQHMSTDFASEHQVCLWKETFYIVWANAQLQYLSISLKTAPLCIREKWYI